MEKGEYALWLSCFLCFGLLGFALTLPGVLLGRHVTEWQGDLVSATLDTYQVESDPDLCTPRPSGPLSTPITTFESSYTNFLFYYQIEFVWQDQHYNLTACDTHTEVYCQECPTGSKQIGISGSSGPRQCPRFTRCSDQDFAKFQVVNDTRIYISDYHDPPYVYLSDPRDIANKLLIAGVFFLCLAATCWYPILRHWFVLAVRGCTRWARREKEVQVVWSGVTQKQEQEQCENYELLVT